MLDDSFDAIAWVGQHAKAGTEFAHMAHTGSFNIIDYQINNVSIGEFGQLALCGAYFGVRAIFGSGDEAFKKEAANLVRGIETVSVKRGIMPGSGDNCDAKAYMTRNNGAIHLHPEKAREMIRVGANRALKRFVENRESFDLLNFTSPYTRKVRFRYKELQQDYCLVSENRDIIRLLNDQAMFISF
jgi:D-amino peptidase